MNKIQELYLDLVRNTVLDAIYQHGTYSNPNYDMDERENGSAWPLKAMTMIGNKRLLMLENLLVDVIDNNIEGDFVETGVWRGGACIYAAAIIEAYSSNKNVWVCDSFDGLPPPNVDKYPADAGDPHHQFRELAIPLEEVQRNFNLLNLLNPNVKFLKGFFTDTMPTAPIEKISILRMDGDMYESTIEVFNYLYPKLSVGGWCIIDDYGIPSCRKAVEDYRAYAGINDEIIFHDQSTVYWQNTENREGLKPMAM